MANCGAYEHTKQILASRLCRHLKYMFQSLCWHPGSSQFFSPRPHLKPLQLMGFPSLAFYSYVTRPILPCILLAPSLLPPTFGLFSLFLLFLSLLSQPSSVYWPCLVHYVVSLFWTFPDAPGCTMIKILSMIKIFSPQAYLGATMSSLYKSGAKPPLYTAKRAVYPSHCPTHPRPVAQISCSLNFLKEI